MNREELLTSEKPIALISVYNKRGIEEFAQGLIDLGWNIVSSGGTAKVLSKAGIPVVDVAEFVGGKAILDHRVVTLSRELHGALLADLSNEQHVADLKNLGVPPIRLVCCDFYPLQDAVLDQDATIDSVIEKTDIGGPAMIRAACKSRISICTLAERKLVLAELKECDNVVSPETIQRLRAVAESEISKYSAWSSTFHSNGKNVSLFLENPQPLKYGENPYQEASVFDLSVVNLNDSGATVRDPLSWGTDGYWKRRTEKMPGFVNITGMDRSVDLLSLLIATFKKNYKRMFYTVVVSKHGNPCGVGVSFDKPEEAILKALTGNADAVMGGEFVCNFDINEQLGELVYAVPKDLQKKVGRSYWGLDAICSPYIAKVSVDLLNKRKAGRVIMVNQYLNDPEMPDSKLMRPIRGAMVIQDPYSCTIDFLAHENRWVSEKLLSMTRVIDMVIADCITRRANSNTICLVKDGQLIGLGCGQQERRGAVALCLKYAIEAGHDTKGSTFGSDAFFPFAERRNPDDQKEGTELLVDAGCRAGVAPHAGKNIEEVKAFFERAGLSVCFIPAKYRGFSAH